MPCDHGLPPLLFKPIYKEKVWGGQALARKLEKSIPREATIGESWELSAVPGDESTAVNAPYSGKTLTSIFKHEKERLVGKRTFPLFPLLYKFIDSHEKLSIQVHPKDQMDRAGMSNVFGKTECWFIVDAKPDARLICGFKKGIGLHDIKDALHRDRLPEVCNYMPINPGDVVFIPAGTVHALFDSVLIYEVQQTSDTTFRLYDWGRIDKNGSARTLHIQEALNAIELTDPGCNKISQVVITQEKDIDHAVRVACRYFALEEYRVTASSSLMLGQKNSFQVVTMLDGGLVYSGAKGEERIAKGQTMLIPACAYPLDLRVEDSAHFLVSYVPDIKADIINPLLKKGVSREAIVGLGGNPSHNDIIALFA